MACLYTTSFSLGCLDFAGGVNKVYLRNHSGDTTYTYDSNGQVTGSTATASWYTIEQRLENSEFKQDGTHAPFANGSTFWTQQLSLMFHKYQASTRNLVYALSQYPLDAIVLLNDGDYFLLGEKNGLSLINSTGNAGKALGDFNGSAVTLEGKEQTMARQCSSGFISTQTFV